MQSICKRMISLSLAFSMSLGLLPSSLARANEESIVDSARPIVDSRGYRSTGAAVADWKFNQSSEASSGSISAGDLRIKDQSGSGNDLEMQFYQAKKVTKEKPSEQVLSDNFQFSSETMDDTSGGSLVLNGDTTLGTGADFVTVQDAPMNQMTFEDGYTIEFVYKLPSDWTASDSWMGLMARQTGYTWNGNDAVFPVQSMDEPQMGSMSVAVSNCKEIQFLTAPAQDDHSMSSAAWSVSMDKGDQWYHIAITSDGSAIRTYVNGCEAFRNYESEDMQGLFADGQDGRFRVGSSWYVETKNSFGKKQLDKFLQGNLQEVRISTGALEKSEWLIQNPEQYLGAYGSNEPYSLKNPDNYNFVFLPDTQNSIRFKPEVMRSAIDGLVEMKNSANVVSVVGLGDVVDLNNQAGEYTAAVDSFYELPRAGMQFLIQKGNHDSRTQGENTYSSAFSKNSSAYMELTKDYLVNNSPSGDSSYLFVNAGSYRYLVLALSCSGSEPGRNNNTAWDAADEAWMKAVLDANSDCPTIVTTHDLQNCSDTVPSAIQLSNRGKKLWELVKSYNQVFMLVGGHSHGAGYEILSNESGNPVISILADYQFAYNGGNGFFKYAQFDENANKIYLETYSPYSASLDAQDKTYFDVNFMTGAGNDDTIPLDFSQRFAGMEVEAPKPVKQGKWMTGEYHTHTGQSKDATSSYMSLENVLAVAFRTLEAMNNIPSAGKVPDSLSGSAYDYLFLADHLRNSYQGIDGQGDGNYTTPFYKAVQVQQEAIASMQKKGLYTNKIFYSGFEWDMPGLDHASVGLISDDSDSVPYEGIHEFEWKYASISDGDATSLYDNNGAAEKANWGNRKGKGNGTTAAGIDTTVEAIQWIAKNYSQSYVLLNHPSRHEGELTIETLRKLNDVKNAKGESIVFGIEGLPGNEMSGSKRGELPASYNGADEMIAKTGGVWDALLSEGRRFWNFTNADFHFKTSENGNYSSGYWPSEYARNYTWVEPGKNQAFDVKDVVAGLRSGNSFSVYGDLISAMDFTAASGRKTAAMGETLDAVRGKTVTVTIRFKPSEQNNYQTIFQTNTGIEVDSTPVVDHVDLISGSVSGKVASTDYNSTENTDAKIIKTFSKEEIGKPDAEGYYTLTYQAPADTNRYYRVRGTSVSAVDAHGDPLPDSQYDSIDKNDERIDKINDFNYASLCFYSNPIFVSARTSGGSDSDSGSSSIEKGTSPSTGTANAPTLSGTVLTAIPAISAPTINGELVTITATIDGASVLNAATNASAATPLKLSVRIPTGSLAEQLYGESLKKAEVTCIVPSNVANSGKLILSEVRLETQLLEAVKSSGKDISVILTDEAGKNRTKITLNGKAVHNSPMPLTDMNFALTTNNQSGGVQVELHQQGLIPGGYATIELNGLAANAQKYIYRYDEANATYLEISKTEVSTDATGAVRFDASSGGAYRIMDTRPANLYPINIDTHYAVIVAANTTYTFRITAAQGQTPILTVGNSNVFQGVTVKKGNDYYFQIQAIGTSGNATGIYCTLNGQKPVQIASAFVA